MRAHVAITALLLLLTTCTVFARRVKIDQGGPGGGGGGGAGSNEGPGGNGGNGGGIGGGEGGQGGWGGPVSQGTDEECITIAKERCPADGSPSPILPNPNDCGAFCMCVAGVGKYIPCAGGLHFSETLQACTWPDDAKCQFA